MFHFTDLGRPVVQGPDQDLDPDPGGTNVEKGKFLLG